MNISIDIDTLVIDKSVLDGLASIPASLKAIADELKVSNALRVQEVKLQEELVGLVRRQWRPARPTGLKIPFKSEREGEGMAKDILTYGVAADAPSDPDTEKRTLKVEIDGAVAREDSLTIVRDANGVAEATVFADVEAPQDSQVKLTVTDIDDGNNPSAPLVFEFQALDQNVPAAPTGLQVAFKGERENPDPAPEPEPTPEPTPEDPT
jgi:hypothetical protein